MRLLFVDLTPGHNPKELYEKPTGGTLTSLTKVPEYLAARGHEVYVSSTYKANETVKGVHYITADTSIPQWDVTVFNRNVLPNDFVTHCKQQGSKSVWWLHDIVDTRYLPDQTYTKVDKIVALSGYCQETFSDFYQIDPAKFDVIPNGIDPEVFFPGPYEKRNKHVFITASAPIKGHIPLDLTYSSLKNYDLDLDFRIYSSAKLHGKENTPEELKGIARLASAGAHVYAPTSQKSMAAIMRKAWCLLMPNSYPEICSNLLLQARACGLPVVSSNIGANPEFLTHRETGMLTTKFHPHDIHSWVVEFARQACILQNEPDVHKRISENAPSGVPTWDEIGGKWNELIQSL